MKIHLLDGTGFVELVDKMGDDLTVVNAARVSFAKESKVLTDGDKKLIIYLAKHKHITPFFHVMITLRLKMPIFVARQWFKHTVGFARNEISRRYVDFEPEFYIPIAEDIRERDTNKKQGSKETQIEESVEMNKLFTETTDALKNVYNSLIEARVAPEVARAILPQSMYTEFIETGSLAAYARLCNLRLDPSAQAETREYAEAVSKILEPLFPVSWKALMG